MVEGGLYKPAAYVVLFRYVVDVYFGLFVAKYNVLLIKGGTKTVQEIFGIFHCFLGFDFVNGTSSLCTSPLIRVMRLILVNYCLLNTL